jgi:hypothetical protein
MNFEPSVGAVPGAKQSGPIEHGASMELWQMDIVGGLPLADGT